jgi:hypothetical protein
MNQSKRPGNVPGGPIRGITLLAGLLVGIGLAEGWIPLAVGYLVTATSTAVLTWLTAKEVDWNQEIKTIPLSDPVSRKDSRPWGIWLAVGLMIWGGPALVFGLSNGDPGIAVPAGIIFAIGLILWFRFGDRSDVGSSPTHSTK